MEEINICEYFVTLINTTNPSRLDNHQPSITAFTSNTLFYFSRKSITIYRDPFTIQQLALFSFLSSFVVFLCALFFFQRVLLFSMFLFSADVFFPSLPRSCLLSSLRVYLHYTVQISCSPCISPCSTPRKKTKSLWWNGVLALAQFKRKITQASTGSEYKLNAVQPLLDVSFINSFACVFFTYIVTQISKNQNLRR